MRISSLLSFVMLAALMFSPVSARAWGWDAHHIACGLAWDELTPPIRAKVADILEAPSGDAAGRDAFAYSCRWADDVIPWRKETAPWHYVNVPKGATTVVLARDCPPPKSCLVEQVMQQAAALRAHHSKDALRYVGHFVGDLNTPLHISYAEDFGANAIKGTLDGVPTNLHAIWDYEMLNQTKRLWPEIAADLHGRITDAQRRAWAPGTPIDWANESLAITLSPAMGYHAYDPPFALGEDYTKVTLPKIYEQLEKSGVRIARVITDALSDVRK